MPEPTPTPSAPEPAPKDPGSHHLFGQEGIPQDTLQHLGDKLKETYQENPMDAAKQLFNLRRAGIAPQNKTVIFKHLRNSITEYEKAGNIPKLATYLKHLRFIGALDKQGITDTQKELINQEITSQLSDRANISTKLSQLCADAKFIGAKDDFSDVADALKSDLNAQREMKNNEGTVALRLARIKYLGLDFPDVGQEEQNPASSMLEKLGITKKINELKEKGRWPQFAALRICTNVIQGFTPLETDVQEKALAKLREMEREAQSTDNWEAYTTYAGHLGRLSRAPKNIQEEREGALGVSSEPAPKPTPQHQEESTPPGEPKEQPDANEPEPPAPDTSAPTSDTQSSEENKLADSASSTSDGNEKPNETPPSSTDEQNTGEESPPTPENSSPQDTSADQEEKKKPEQPQPDADNGFTPEEIAAADAAHKEYLKQQQDAAATARKGEKNTEGTPSDASPVPDEEPSPQNDQNKSKDNPPPKPTTDKKSPADEGKKSKPNNPPSPPPEQPDTNRDTHISLPGTSDKVRREDVETLDAIIKTVNTARKITADKDVKDVETIAYGDKELSIGRAGEDKKIALNEDGDVIGLSINEPIIYLDNIVQLKNLRELDIRGTRIKKLDLLQECKNLKKLTITAGTISRKRIDKLKKALPDLEVIEEPAPSSPTEET